MNAISPKNIFIPIKPKVATKTIWKPLFLFLFLATFPLAANAQIITTVAGTGVAGYSGNGGAATSAQMNGITSVVVDAAGNMYISDYFNNVVRRVDAVTGIITTIAGTNVAGFSGDGGPATSAELNGPAGLVLDGAGNLYIADSANDRIRKLNLATGIITTVAGNGTAGYSGDGGPATSAQIDFPSDVTLDAAGNLYFADYYNNVIRRVDKTTGIITTFVGTGTPGFTGDGGPATAAQISSPDSVKFDAAGNLYFSDTGNYRIRRVAAGTGIITTVAGNGTAGFSGDGGPATSASFDYPGATVFDSAGNMYVTDEVNGRIREVNAATGIVTTVVGNGTVGYSGDGGPPLLASLDHPEAMFIDSAGNFYIADGLNNVVRKVTNLVVAYTPTITPTPTNTYTPTMTFTGTVTVTPTFTNTFSITPTFSYTSTSTFTSTPTYTSTSTYTPTITPTFTLTLPPGTDTYTPIPTNTFTPTYTPTFTYTLTSTYTFTATYTPTITATPTITSTPTNSPTATPNFDIFYVSKNLWSPTSDGPVSMYVAYSKYGGEYSFRIYNTAGEHIKTIDAYRPTQPISKTYFWDGKNKNGDPCASGMYILYLIEPFDRKIKRILLVR